jgi:hypothetical protein
MVEVVSVTAHHFVLAPLNQRIGEADPRPIEPAAVFDSQRLRSRTDEAWDPQPLPPIRRRSRASFRDDLRRFVALFIADPIAKEKCPFWKWQPRPAAC